MDTKSSKSGRGMLWIMLMLCFACAEHNLYKGEEEKPKPEFNDFDFSTTQEVNLQVSYQNMGGIQTAVYFEVYDEMPVIETEYNYVKKEGVLPLFGYTTEEDGTFSKKLTLPAYAKTLYIYTPAFYARTLIEAKVENGVVVATDAIPKNKSVVTKGTVNPSDPSTSEVLKEDGWKTLLGKFYSGYFEDNDEYYTGYITYEYTGNLKYSYWQDLYNVHTSVIDINKACPEEYRVNEDFYVAKEGEVAITFLGGNTCWNSSLGYYYYPEGNPPASLKEANVIMIFPNTQDGLWKKGNWEVWATKGVKRGTAVQLKYYPNLANGKTDGVTTKFPANYRIGFVLATNAWTNRIEGKTAWTSYRASTSKDLSISKDGDKIFYNGNKRGDNRRSAVYRYKNKDKNAIIFSFEDNEDDDNFSDVVFTVKTNPEDMISDIPVVENPTQTTTTKIGVYAFEDMWPAQGDYDMNDVLVNVGYEKTFEKKEISSEAFTFKTSANKAVYINGLGVTFENAQGAKVSLTIDGESADLLNGDGSTYLLTDNVKNYMGKEYKLTLTYKGSKGNTEQAKAKAFIWKPGEAGQGNWEVHIPKEKPTSFADVSDRYFGTQDDRSDPKNGIYYVRDNQYPFAFFLSGCTESDISPLLDAANESVKINELYPKYSDWATSNGTKNPDWYK